MKLKRNKDTSEKINTEKTAEAQVGELQNESIVASTEKTKKKPLDIVRIVITIIFVIAAISIMIFTIISVRTFDRADRNLFGYKAFIVLSDSMSATDFEAGDLILVKEEDPSTFVEGDIISYTSTADSNYGEIVTHKIRTITTTEGGAPAFITYGTTTGEDDPNPVTYEYVIGKYKKAIPNVGSFFMFLKTVPGYLICIFLPFFVLILMQGINSVRLFRQYKAEELAEMEAERTKQKAEMDEERRRLEAERLESMRMIEELKRVQAQMAAGQAPSTEPGSVAENNMPSEKSIQALENDRLPEKNIQAAVSEPVQNPAAQTKTVAREQLTQTKTVAREQLTQTKTVAREQIAQTQAAAREQLTKEQQKERLLQIKASMTEEQWKQFVEKQRKLIELKKSMTPEQWEEYKAKHRKK